MASRRAVVRRHAGGGAAGVLAALVEELPEVPRVWKGARIDASTMCSDSSMLFGYARPVWRDVLLAGDAAALPHPLGGDGVAMALRAGRLAAQHAGLERPWATRPMLGLLASWPAAVRYLVQRTRGTQLAAPGVCSEEA